MKDCENSLNFYLIDIIQRLDLFTSRFIQVLLLRVKLQKELSDYHNKNLHNLFKHFSGLGVCNNNNKQQFVFTHRHMQIVQLCSSVQLLNINAIICVLVSFDVNQANCPFV